jgi:hypothetical protein
MAEKATVTLTLGPPYTSTFRVVGYTNENGVWRVEMEAATPPPGGYSNVVVDILETELPANINQNQLASLLKTRLGWKLNQTFVPLNTFMENGTTVTLP